MAAKPWSIMFDFDVTATLYYLNTAEKKPVYYASSRGVAEHDTGVRFEPHEVNIANGRQMSEPAKLDIQGFTQVSHHTAVTDFYQLGHL